ncbi:MAG: hypothetical protein HFH82_10080 [Lachnospiraceae bacterium]|nr:hypothetical protein [Lachnospiraceae bacterium]
MNQAPQGESIWGTINSCVEIALNVYMIVATDQDGIEHEGVMVHKETAGKRFSKKAQTMGEMDGEWLCYGEETKDIPLYEMLRQRVDMCRHMETAVLKQMEEMRRDGKLALAEYFGECLPPIKAPENRIKEMFHVRNGIYLTQDDNGLKLAVHEVVADNYMTLFAGEYGQKEGDYLFYSMGGVGRATCAIALNELKNVYEEVAALIISEESLYATLYQEFGSYTDIYNHYMPKQERIPKTDAPVNLFLAIQLEAVQNSLEEGTDREAQKEGDNMDLGEQVDYGIEP